MRFWLGLLAKLRLGVPAAIEQDEHDPDIVLGGDAKEAVDAIRKSVGVIFPGQVMQEDANGI